jgi:hypothetical protein
MPLHADLYLDRINLTRYAGTETCRICQVDCLEQLVDRLRSGRFCAGQCPHWPRERIAAFRVAIGAGQALPTIPSLQVPRPAAAGWFDLNEPTASSPALITSNSQLTHEVLLAVLSTISAPLWMVSVDTGGHTVDMSLVFGTLTPAAIAHAIETHDTRPPSFAGPVLLPGLAEPLAAPLPKLLGHEVKVGPICAAELPLFFMSEWTR